ncbi:Imm8 family immunity protein [Paenibacillus peoriae]|uniref:Imm8 family immunity protein n=1 Tax=Paenibacillus peoriae TaxID=59893 RepID=UPI00096E1F38|nr:Imm8 family immunity protein [Paenibacillus peoriae]OMF51148.1 hypothetical protein BK135_02595 [Paenibacillus peoriae]
MIRPVLKSIDCIGNPDTSNDFVIGATAYIGEENSEGVDYFHFRIMTPTRLLAILEEDKFLDGRATFIVNEFDLSLVEKEINKILEDCIRRTWDDVAKAINRHLKWEYDNIQYETLDEAMARLNKEN